MTKLKNSVRWSIKKDRNVKKKNMYHQQNICELKQVEDGGKVLEVSRQRVVSLATFMHGKDLMDKWV